MNSFLKVTLGNTNCALFFVLILMASCIPKLPNRPTAAVNPGNTINKEAEVKKRIPPQLVGASLAESLCKLKSGKGTPPNNKVNIYSSQDVTSKVSFALAPNREISPSPYPSGALWIPFQLDTVAGFLQSKDLVDSCSTPFKQGIKFVRNAALTIERKQLTVAQEVESDCMFVKGSILEANVFADVDGDAFYMVALSNTQMACPLRAAFVERRAVEFVRIP